MFDSTRIRQLQSSLNEHDYAIMGLRSSIAKLQERNDLLESQIRKQRHLLSLLTDHLGVDIRFVEEHYEVFEKEEPNVD